MTARVTDLEITYALQRVVVGGVLVVLAFLLGLVVATGAEPIDLDAWWNSLVTGIAPGFEPVSLFMNAAGGGWIATFAVPLGGLLVLVLMRRPWAGVYLIAASLGSVLLVQLLKQVFGRARPEEILVVSDYGSFPSGHTANAATLAAVAVIVFPRLWVTLVAAAWVVLMAFSRTHVHAHWFSDTVGGALAGVGAALLVAAAFTVPLYREQERHRLRKTR
ncbi:phosphatase PAP2 family protein [Microbacterium invictum]|uniref:Undecaprenyl-diphosphatase n=1 Tax=Microbacterium invictum TaxID=515415 RepID=A0AA40SLF9_9MICO|nr:MULTISPECIES: phosphatase PAP2 family protein [Microbacterium]MBB4138352.1 undecaprenyl-diphosphatase [Microbacterium invictum]